VLLVFQTYQVDLSIIRAGIFISGLDIRAVFYS